ncbi:MAG: helix-turn-helix transcriptional regulator [Alphaproteobacteria bacterium]
MNEPLVYSVQRAVERLDTSESTIRRLIRDGKIRAVRLSLRRIGIPAAEIERIAREGISAA